MSKKISYKDQRLTEAQQKKSKAIKSAGIKNYLGEQENVTVPKKWLSSPDHVVAELAYITPREQKILLDADLYGSLNGEPNRGPGGIMSLQGAGDGGGVESDGKGGHTGTGGQTTGTNTTGPGKQGNFRETSNITNTTGGPRATGPSYSVARDAKGNPFTGSGGPDLIDGRPEAEVVRDLIKAQAIYDFKPSKLINYVPYLNTTRKFFGTPFTKTGKTLTAQKRMNYINSLPPEQKKAMIERLGLAEDDDYDENDVFDSNYDKDFSQDLTSIYGKGINTLSNDPLSYQGETPLYGMDAYDILNYDGKFPNNGPPVGAPEGNIDFTKLPTIPKTTPTEDEEDTGPDYRFGTGQDVVYDSYGTPGYRTTRAAEGGIMGTRARRAMGGIMERVDQRQGYFLGSIVKSVKNVIGGVADAAGKVLKSDLGRYAIMAAGMYYGGGGANIFAKGAANKGGFMGGLKAMGSNFMSTKNPLLFSGGDLNLYKLAGISTALPFLMPAAKPNEMSFSDRGGQLIDPITGKPNDMAGMRENIELAKLEADGDPDKLAAIDQKYNNMLNLQLQANLPDANPYLGYGEPGYRTTRAATGGRIGYAEGGLLDLGGMEKDYRAEGGFVPIGEYEKKDDVPARLSVNEFVMTADAVRGAGQGDIDKGAEIMENMMKNLENGGTVSEESQGNKGAQNMFKTSERLGAII